MRQLLMIYIDGQLQHFAGPIVQMSLMEPTLDDNDKSDTGVTLDTNAKEETEAVELLRVELVLNVPPKEEGSKFSSYLRRNGALQGTHLLGRRRLRFVQGWGC